MTQTDLVTLASRYAFSETLARFEAALEEKGISLFAKIDHAANAASVDQTLRPTTLLIFGKPEAGTPLMADQQQIGLDLPLKLLIWEDADSQTWLTHADVSQLAARHQLSPAGIAHASKLEQVLAGLASHAGGVTAS